MKLTRKFKIILTILFLLVLGFTISFALNNPLKKKVVIEVGERIPSIEQFLIDSNENAEFITDLNQIDTSVMDQYTIEIKVGLFTKETQLEINDTVPPFGKGINHEIWYDEKLKANDFVKDIEDKTSVRLEYSKEPNFDLIGKQTIEIVLIDEGNNKSHIKADLIIKDDTESPRILGVKDRLIFIDEPVSFRRGIEVLDNKDNNLDFVVENSKVNLKVPGKYEVLYTATDLAGNETTKKSIITVKEKPPFLLSHDELNERADKILNNITYDGMTELEILESIFWYTRWNIKYTGQSDKTSWEIGASKALVSMDGDCFNYYSLAHLLLKRAGFEIRPVKRVKESRSRHYWLFVKYNDLWYFYDPTWTPLGYEFDGFMISESEAEAFTKLVSPVRENYYVYDKNLFQDIKIADEPLELN